MFGSIGTFNAAGSRFNNAAGDQYNTDIAPMPGMAGPMDAQFKPHLAASGSALPTPRRTTAAHMFGDIDRFHADRSVFSNAAGDQYNYDHRHSVVPPLTPTPSVTPDGPIALPPTAQSAPSPHKQNTPSPKITPSSAEARMFGRIDHFQSENSVYNNGTGNQINVQGHPSAAAPATNPSEPSPQSNTTRRRSHNPFSSKSNIAAPRGKMDMALGVTDFVLTTLQTTAQCCPIPFLAQAAGVTLTILQCVQGSMANKDGFARLASHACNLISSVVVVQKERERDGKELAPEVVANLVDLVGKLRPIEEFVLKQNTRHGLKRLFLYKADAGKVAENRQKLMEALAEFGLRSNISVQDGVAQIDKRLEDLVEAVRHIGLQHAHANGSSASTS